MPGRAGRNRNRDPHHYWNTIASIKPEAQALTTRLGLDFPSSQTDGFKSGLTYPIRRLVVTGEDTHSNMAILLGPLWEAKAWQAIKDTRIDVHLRPPPGSPSRKFSEHLDAGTPRWAPGGPSVGEEDELAKIRDVKKLVAGHLGGRKNVQTGDIKDILTGMGGDWEENLGPLMAAMNGMDQVVM